MEEQDVYLLECARCGSTQFEHHFGGAVHCAEEGCGQLQTTQHYEPAALELLN